VLAAALCVFALVAEADDVEAPAQPAPPAFDRSGLKRDTAYFLGYQFVAVGVMSLMPDDDTNYQDKLGFGSWRYNVTHPQWDPDDAFVNYVLHPYWGAAYYIRGRERGLTRTQGFWYSALLSTIYEFGAEAMVERVSYQDLVITPVLGSLLGEYVFVPWRQRILGQDTLSTSDRVVLVLTDPLDAINSVVERWFGLDAHLSLALPRTGGPVVPAIHTRWPTTPVPRPRWGLQLRLVW
jgi:hypothetical protein